MSDNLTTPALAQYSDTDHSAWLLVASYILVFVSILVSAVRLLWRFRIMRTLLVDDWLILVATLIAVIQTVSITTACKYGLGKHETALSPHAYEQFSKSIYAAQILIVPAVGLTKASTIQTIATLRPHKIILLSCYGLHVFNILWIVSGIFAFAFKCAMPSPWNTLAQNCVDQSSLMKAFWIISVASDVSLIVLPSVMMTKVQTTAFQRWMIVALFGSRVIVPIMTVLGLISMHDYFRASPPDQSWYAVTPTLYFQLMLNFSLITTSIPSIKRFIADLRSHASAAELTKDWAHSASGYRTGSVSWNSHADRKGNSQVKSHVSSRIFQVSESSKAKIERCESIEGLTDDIIMQTIDFKVEVEEGRELTVSCRETSSQHSDGRKVETNSIEYCVGTAQ